MEGYTARYELNGVNNTVTENAELHQPFVWTRKSTALLIQLYKERLLRFRDPKQMKRSLWGEIVKKFEEHGYKGLNEDIVDRKFRNMKKTFRTITEKKISTGQGRVAWEYFDDFVEIFEEDRTLNFGHFFSTMEPSSQPPIVSSQPYSCATTVTSNQASTSYASSSSSPSPDPIIPSTEMTDVQPNDVEFLKKSLHFNRKI
ncbi:hypothetical protein NQ314_008722 [Rhamnusium bicolor]|uniref:Myb/SANT-like DNA-binding domain-containing protein n=1 Tax=Rhamnusium bicolor TaxID=1586634 RepID=A0AAV8Y8N6_9CUCU|nr:hypothetical protein NQ314_008722 [Rhamnusium bicolor]